MGSKAVVLLSGGLDSFTAAAVARRDGFSIHALSINYGQRHVRELAAARNVARALGAERHLELELDLARIGGSSLTSAARLATKAGVEGHALAIHTPLIDLTKAAIIKLGVSLGLDYGITHSCYDPRPDGSPCRRCDSCQLRASGFAEAGIDDPLISRRG